MELRWQWHRPRDQQLVLGLILLVSLALRVWYGMSVWDDELTTIPYLDAAEYDRWARALTGGDWGVGQPYWMGPLYPHLLALTYTLFGDGSRAMLIIQWGLGLLNVLLVHRLGGHWLGPRGALLAAALYAGYGPPVFYGGLYLMVTLVTTLVLLVTLQARLAVAEPSRSRWLVLGLLIGLTALARGNVMIWLVLLPLAPLTATRRDRWRLAGWLWLGSALMIAPVTIRNVAIGHDLVLLTSNGGVNLLIGQQTGHGGRFAPADASPRLEFDPSGRTQLEQEAGHQLKPSAVSRELARRALRRLVAEPGVMARHYGRKVALFLGGDEVPQIYSWNVWRSRSAALRAMPVPAVLLLALGLVGWTTLPRPSRRLWLLLVGGWFVSLLPFFPTARYRLPIMGLVVIAASAMVVATVTAARAGRRRRAFTMAAVGAVLLVMLWPTWLRLDPDVEWWLADLNRAARAALVADVATVEAAVADAETRRPGLAETAFRRGDFLGESGALEQALAAYLEAARRDPSQPFTLYRVGSILADLGRHREALVWYDRAAALDSTWAYPWHGRGLSWQALGELDEAIAAWERAAALDPGRPRYRSNLASALELAGHRQEARAILTALVTDFPQYVPGWFNLALTEARSGNRDAARRALAQADAVPGLTAEQRASIDALRRRLARPANQ